MKRPQSAFTIVELLIVLSIIAVLMSLLLPAVGGARERAGRLQSESNLRNLATAHATYASDWNGRQFTLSVDTLTSYGDTPDVAVTEYYNKKGEYPPVIALGWGRMPGDPQDKLYAAQVDPTDPTFDEDNYSYLTPMVLEDDRAGFGWFRVPNAMQFNKYLSGRFYDPVFYAPNDRIVMSMFRQTEGAPGSYTPKSVFGWGSKDFCYSSYCLSPAALYSPEVLSLNDETDEYYTNPWTLATGFRAPALGHARYPALKTHMIEHHWIQNTRGHCNPNFLGGAYEECEPWYFNHSTQSAPVAMFYDAHVESISVLEAQTADGRARAQSGHGLWSRDTPAPLGNDGYFINFGYDIADTSFHILTIDGIKGRDKLGG